MGDNNLEETIRLQRMFADLSEFEKQQAREDLDELRGKTTKMIFKVQGTVKSLRQAANKLDEVWKGSKKAHAFGTTAGIVGGVLTIGGGVATIMTAGIASPLLIAGMGAGVVGAGTNLGTSIVEASLNSTEIKKAEKDLKETLDCINDVEKTVQLWLDRKEKARLFYIFCLAMKTLKMSDPAIKFLQQVILRASCIPKAMVEAARQIFAEVGRHCTQTAGKAGAQAARQAGAKAAGRAGAKAAGKSGAKATGQAGTEAAGRAGAQAAGDFAESSAKAGAKAGGKFAGGMIIGVSTAFLVWDFIDLGFTIRDLVENKGSEAASFLRDKADELETAY